MAVGAAQAVADSGKSGVKDVYVVGFNGDENRALQAIKAGQMGATIEQVPEQMGKMTVQLATKLMNGEKLQYDNPEKRDVYVPVKLITATDVGALKK